MASIAARRPTHRNHPALKSADSYEARLTVVFPLVRPVECDAAENDRGIREVEISLGNRPVTLAGIERDRHKRME